MFTRNGFHMVPVRRAFLKSPEKFSGPRTFRDTFRALFSGSEKCFSMRPKEPRIFSLYFRRFFRVGHVLVLECFGFSPMFSYVATAVSSCSCKLTVHLCSFMNTAWQCQRCCLVLASFLSHSTLRADLSRKIEGPLLAG